MRFNGVISARGNHCCRKQHREPETHNQELRGTTAHMTHGMFSTLA